MAKVIDRSSAQNASLFTHFVKHQPFLARIFRQLNDLLMAEEDHSHVKLSA